jgi:tetrahydromethanopterin S-methyltransferase subunit G
MTEIAIIEPVAGEATNLALHTELCAQRYNQLMAKFDEVDGRLDQIHETLTDIHRHITDIRSTTANTHLKWAGAVITILVGIVIHFVVQ